MSDLGFAVLERRDYYGPRSEWRYIASAETEGDAARLLEGYEGRASEYLAHNEYGRQAMVLPVVSAGADVYQDWTMAPSEVEDVALRIYSARCDHLAELHDPPQEWTADSLPASIDDDMAAALAECGYVAVLDEAGDLLVCKAA